MTVQRIRLLGDDVLWRPCEPVARPGGPEVADLLGDLRDTLRAFRRDHGFGRGIAAPQIGDPRRVVVIEAPAQGFSDGLINPGIRYRSESTRLVWDFCFSIPDLVVQVVRAERVTVEYHDPAGRPRSVEADGDLAELLQHEIDHLDGILMLERAATPRSIWSRAEWERAGGPRLFE